MTFLTNLYQMLKPRSEAEQRRADIDHYLGKSVDRCDLERRERELERKGYFR